jgi:transcription initiation factor TFIID subunit 11
MFYRVLVSNFTEEQLDRYEMYRRSAFPKASIKRVMEVLLYEHILFKILYKVSVLAYKLISLT